MYDDGMVSRLMDRGTARDYADMFGGTVHLHSSVVRRRKNIRNFLVFLAGLMALVAAANAAQADQFKPLTRAEPIVRMVLQESANEPVEGQIAVAGVALDRVEDKRWPNTAKAVVYQPWQFTGMRIKLRRYSRKQIERARHAVEIARTGYRPCGEVYWYHTEDVSPRWAKRFRKHCQIGEHLFYGD